MKKKLLFLTNSLSGGGAEKVLHTLLNNLDLTKYSITVYSVNEDKSNICFPSGIKFRYIFKQCAKTKIEKIWAKILNKIKLTIYYKFSPKTFYRLFIRGIYDTEIAFIEGYSTRIIGGSTNPDSKKIAWVHIDLENNHWTSISYKNNTEESIIYSKFNEIVCVSNDVMNSMQQLFPHLKTLTIKYNPIDDNLIRNLASSNSKLSNNKPDKIKLISIGRLVHQKGYDRLLPIIKNLIDCGFNISLTILGEGSDRQKLENYIKNNNLTEYIFLPGFIENPYQTMSEADLFVCSSRSEGYSTVITEALICGLPIVTTNCSGMNELLGNNEYGVITNNDSIDLQFALQKILTDKNMYKHYKKMALIRGQQFKLATLIKQIEKIFT